jgi:hypothetical protein
MCDVTARIQSHIEVDFRICIWIWIRNRIETNTDPKHWYGKFPYTRVGLVPVQLPYRYLLIVINKLA